MILSATFAVRTAVAFLFVDYDGHVFMLNFSFSLLSSVLYFSDEYVACGLHL